MKLEDLISVPLSDFHQEHQITGAALLDRQGCSSSSLASVNLSQLRCGGTDDDDDDDVYAGSFIYFNVLRPVA